jgi:crotonobetainyl-CoA:carnitine CoA-transferase CaiB-like acyl-CoA transferase
MSSRFLSGLRVVTLGTGIAGPLAGRMLASYGAEVFKVESRAGGIDAFRTYGDDLDASPRFIEMNLNTRSVTLNLKTSLGVKLFKELVGHCDVVMENFRPGVLQGLGLSPRDLLTVKQDLIIVRMPGLGSVGRQASYGTWGPTLAAYCGLTYLWNHARQDRPVGSQGVYPDYVTAVMAPIVVMAALLARKRTGEGTVVELTQVDLAAYMLGTTLLDVLVNDRDPAPTGNASLHAVPHNCYPCAGEDRWCVIAVENENQWRALCSVIGQPELVGDERFCRTLQRWHNRSDLDALLSDWTAQHDASEVMRRLQAAGVPAGVVASGMDLYTDEHLEARGFIQSVRHPVLGEVPLAGLPLQFDTASHETFRSPPPLGADNSYVLIELLGHTRADLERWEREEVVY